MAEPTVKDILIASGTADKTADRAIARGLDADGIEWNRRLGRPLAFVETVHPAEETKRRDVWTAAEEAKAKVAPE